MNKKILNIVVSVAIILAMVLTSYYFGFTEGWDCGYDRHEDYIESIRKSLIEYRAEPEPELKTRKARAIWA